METRESDGEAVDRYMTKLRHPLAVAAQAVREAILASGAKVGEEIKWNAPTFFYTGPLPPSNPKEFRRYLVVFNFQRKDCLRLVFLKGAAAADKTGFLGGDYADGRRIAEIHDLKEAKARKAVLQRTIRKQITALRAL